MPLTLFAEWRERIVQVLFGQQVVIKGAVLDRDSHRAARRFFMSIGSYYRWFTGARLFHKFSR